MTAHPAFNRNSVDSGQRRGLIWFDNSRVLLSILYVFSAAIVIYEAAKVLNEIIFLLFGILVRIDPEP